METASEFIRKRTGLASFSKYRDCFSYGIHNNAARATIRQVFFEVAAECGINLAINILVYLFENIIAFHDDQPFFVFR